MNSRHLAYTLHLIYLGNYMGHSLNVTELMLGTYCYFSAQCSLNTFFNHFISCLILSFIVIAFFPFNFLLFLSFFFILISFSCFTPFYFNFFFLFKSIFNLF